MDPGQTLPPPDETVDQESNRTLAPPSGLPRSYEGQRFGQYVVLKELARGGQGVVLEARHEGLNKQVALKLLLDPNPHHVLRFKQEARVLARLEHPNVATVDDFGEERGVPYMAMRYVRGESLKDVVDRSGVPPFEWTEELVETLAGALSYCHGKGVVHRDLKPANVMIEKATGKPVIVDFGLLSRDAELFSMQSLDDRRTQLTDDEQILGTPSYMATEQADRGTYGEIGPHTDVYALGATLYYLLTKEPPYTGATAYNVIVKLMQQPPPDPREVNPEVPAHLAELCLHAMAKQPADRPEMARLLAGDSAVVRGFPRMAWLGVGSALLVGLVGVLLVGAAGSQDHPDPTKQRHEALASPTTTPVDREAVNQGTAALFLEEARRALVQGDHEASLEALDKAIDLAPNKSRLYFERAGVKGRMKVFQGALDDYERGLALEPDNATALANRGMTKLVFDDFTGALEDMERAMELLSPMDTRHRELEDMAERIRRTIERQPQ